MSSITLSFPSKQVIVNFLTNDPGLMQACTKFLSEDSQKDNETNTRPKLMAADITDVATKQLGNRSKTLLSIQGLAERVTQERTHGTKREFQMVSRALQNALCNCALEAMRAWQATCKQNHMIASR